MTYPDRKQNPTMGRPGATGVEEAARVILAEGFAKDGSAFTPGHAIWTAVNAEVLVDTFVKKPDASSASFMSKLHQQLASAPSDARQLMAELIYLNVLPLSDYHGATKRSLVTEVLGWCDRPVELPQSLSGPLEDGVFNGGVAFKTGRWQQLSYLVQLVGRWKRLADDVRQAALGDPWAWRDLVMSTPGPKVPAQRSALLYLAFPETFVPIVSTDHKRRIRAAFAEYVDAPSGDLDRDLAALRQAVERERGEPVDLYRPPWVARWKPAKADAEPASSAEVADELTESRRAWLVRGSNVNGRNLVPVWLDRGSCSLPASLLRSIDEHPDREQLTAMVEQAYAHVSYNARAEKVAEFDAFLNRMTAGDLVLTVSAGAGYLGVITGDAVYLKSNDDRSNLRRPVDWVNAAAPLDFADLPGGLKARLSSQHAVVDLTTDLPALERLVAGFTAAVPATMPEPVVEAQLPDPTPELAETLLIDQAWLQECVDLLRERRQLIFYGPPGTGKTYLAQAIAEHLAGRDGVKLVQFHPAYSYEDFFEGYRPVPAADGNSVGFMLSPGPFRRLVDVARENPGTPYVLIIDEINRSNIAKVFGELYFLLEYRDRSIDLLYSAGDEAGFTLPKNVYLIGTMNTADRSIALVDAAMRRRFAFLELHPSAPPASGVLSRWLAGTHLPDTSAQVLDRLNALIDDDDFKIGPSYFMRESVHEPGGLERMWRTSILPLLEEHHYGESIDVAKRYDLAKIMRSVTGGDGAQDGPADANQVADAP